MSVSTTSTFNKAINGLPSVGADVDLRDVSSSPKFAVGQVYRRSDGAEFAYAHFGSVMTQGRLCSQYVVQSAEEDLGTSTVVSPNACQNTNDGTTGSRYVEVTAASVTKDQYAGGTIGFVTGEGAGYTREIIGNTATGNPASGNYRLELDRPLTDSLLATTGILIAGNKYANLYATSAINSPSDVIFAGVALETATAGQYGWIQTKGITSVLQNGALVPGQAVLVSTAGAPGAVSLTSNTVLTKQLGTCVAQSSTTNYALIDLSL